MPRSSPRTLIRDNIYAQLKGQLLSCEIPPGAEIRGQEVADSFGVSMSPVRDALHRLEGDGLIDVRPRNGYYARKISLEDALELYEMRIVLESACMERAVRAASDADLAALDPFRFGPTTGSRREWIANNRNFHLLLASLSGNRRLTLATHEIILAFDRLTLASISQPLGAVSKGASALEILDREHSEIITALKERDAKLAVQLTRIHIELSRTRFLESYQGTRF